MLRQTRELQRILRTFDWGPRQIIDRSKNVIAYQLFDNFAFSPKRVLFYLTYKCNLRCKMCWWWGECGAQPTVPDLSLSDVKSIISKVRRYNPSISFTGGEILTRKDILDILQHTKEQGLRIEIFTNGTLITQDLAKDLVRLVDRFMFSVEGPQEIHDQIRGKGSFDRTTRGIRLVQEAAGASRRQVAVRMNCVISSLSLLFLEKAVDVASSLRCRLTFEHLMFSTEQVASKHNDILRNKFGTDVNSSVSGFVTDFHEMDAELLIGKLREVNERASQLGVSFVIVPFLHGERQIREWYSGVLPLPGMRCMFPWTFLYIKPNGDITPCEFIDCQLGNALDDDLKTIWNGSKLREFRKTLKESLFPGCTRCCELLPWPSP